MNGRALVAWNIRKLRVERGLSQEKLAADAGIDRAYLGGVERETENPTVDVLDRVAAALDISIGALFTPPRRGEKRPPPLSPGRKPG
jgi:transcriptional regulator with XRE-family HTH domain